MKYVRHGWCTFIFCCVSSLVWGQFSLWDGEVNNDWHETKNWSGDTLPAVGDSVVVDGGMVLIDANVNIKSLVLLNGTQLTNNQILTLSGSLSDGLLVDGSTMTNNSKVEIPDVGDGDFEDRAIDVTNNGTFNNAGSIKIDSAEGYSIRVEEGSAFVNEINGTITVMAESFVAILVVNLNSTFENNGSIEITLELASSTVRGISSSSAGLFTNNNLVTITSNQSDPNIRCITVANVGRYVNTGETELFLDTDNASLELSSNGSSFEVDDGILRVHSNSSRGIKMSNASELIVAAAGEIRLTGTVQGYFLDMSSDALLDCAGEMQLGN